MTKRDDNTYKPEWTSDETDSKFASRVMRGVNDDKTASKRPTPRRRDLSIEDHVQGVLAGDRSILARTITLVESNAPAHIDKAQEVLRQLLPHTGESIRVGVTGVPGAGKSTLIEALGMQLLDADHHIAVLAVDPSSSVTRGSILGDKTRMEQLSMQKEAFIRPSPSGGVLGGVARKSRETLLVCEAAGFDVVLVETVGTGQSEIAVRSMVDFFLLVLITGAGDELQGIKKGIVELADAILINKADGENKIPAQAARAEYNRALHYLTPATQGWRTRAYTGSAQTGDGLQKIWDVIESFQQRTTESGVFAARRKAQNREWLHTLVEEQLKQYFFSQPSIKRQLPEIEQAVAEGTQPATAAARQLLNLIRWDSDTL
jgi:LAO/AO transport system kinase